jgi:hypothetical protein
MNWSNDFNTNFSIPLNSKTTGVMISTPISQNHWTLKELEWQQQNALFETRRDAKHGKKASKSWPVDGYSFDQHVLLSETRHWNVAQFHLFFIHNQDIMCCQPSIHVILLMKKHTRFRYLGCKYQYCLHLDFAFSERINDTIKIKNVLSKSHIVLFR